MSTVCWSCAHQKHEHCIRANKKRCSCACDWRKEYVRYLEWFAGDLERERGALESIVGPGEPTGEEGK